MNPPNQPLRPNHPPTFCERHPEEHFIGVCHLCLSERLTVLDQNSSSSSKPSISSIANAAFKAIVPKIRRLNKSFSALKYEGLCRSQRKSCDVITGRSTLLSLFNQDEEWKASRMELVAKTDSLASSSVAQEDDNIVHDEITVLESPKPETPNVETRVPKIVEEETKIEPKSDLEVKRQMDMDSQEKKSFGRDWKGGFGV